MNPKIKKDIKEWLELIALSAIGGFVVFHINGKFAPDTETDKNPTKTEIVKPAALSDTIALDTLKNAKQIKR